MDIVTQAILVGAGLVLVGLGGWIATNLQKVSNKIVEFSGDVKVINAHIENIIGKIDKVDAMHDSITILNEYKKTTETSLRIQDQRLRDLEYAKKIANS